jgi:hypothetical protein
MESNNEHNQPCTCGLSALPAPELVIVAIEQLFGPRLRREARYALRQYASSVLSDMGGLFTLRTPPNKSGTVSCEVFSFDTEADFHKKTRHEPN